MKAICIQQAPVIDGLFEDGEARHQLPYPLYADENGWITNQDFWRGKIARVWGFQNNVRVQKLDLVWSEVWADPSLAVGKYLVTSDSEDQWSSWPSAVDTAEVTDIDPALGVKTE